MKELIAAIFVVVVLPIVLIIAVQYWIESSKCDQMRTLMGLQTHASISTGCLVKHRGQWMTADTAMTNMRQVEIK